MLVERSFAGRSGFAPPFKPVTSLVSPMFRCSTKISQISVGQWFFQRSPDLWLTKNCRVQNLRTQQTVELLLFLRSQLATLLILSDELNFSHFQGSRLVLWLPYILLQCRVNGLEIETDESGIIFNINGKMKVITAKPSFLHQNVMFNPLVC